MERLQRSRQCGLSVGLLVSDDLSEPRRTPDDKKLEFCGERNWETLYNQKRKRNSTVLQISEKTRM